MPSYRNYASVSGTFLQDNERSYVIQVISEINEYLRDKDISIKRAGGERTINGWGFVKFPDVLLFADASTSVILQGWEAKCPDVAIDNPDFVEDAHKKARLLNCNSTVLWNFQYAQLHVLNDEGEFEIVESWTIDQRIVDRDAVSRYQNEWKHFLHQLIDKIAEYTATGTIKHRALGDVLTNALMPVLINENKGAVASSLRAVAATNAKVSAYIDIWWDSARREYMHDETDPYFAYAKNILVNWLNKFLFANIIQSSFDGARVIGHITEGCDVQEALDDFDLITSRCDFHNVFAHLPYSECIPDITWDDLVSFNELLLECEMTQLDSEYSQKILEESISVSKRQIAGQYPTPKPLAQLMSAIAVQNAYGAAWDCCCGTGTIGCSIWEQKVDMLTGVSDNPQRDAYHTTWMSDIHDFPLQVATQSFASLAPVKTPLLVFQDNVFDVAFGKTLKVVDPASGAERSVEIPQFDTIVSNLPFVDFNTTEIVWYDVVKEKMKRKYDMQGIILSDRNDLYSYIALYLEELLSEDGVACLLTSNSWLCSSAGDSFMRALRATFAIEGIYASGKHRWFSSADVMNALIVLRKKGANASSSVYLGVIGASIEQLEDTAIRKRIGSAIITHSEIDPALFHEIKMSWSDIDALKEKGLSYYSMCHDISFMTKAFPKLCGVSSLFDVVRGIKSGQDPFFYSSDAGFVDEDFCLNLLKNMKEVSSFELNPNYFTFRCSMSKKELEDGGYHKTLAHINSVSNVNASCKSHRPYWYTLPPSPKLDFATMMNPDSRLFFAGVPEGRPFAANQRAICFGGKNDIDKDLVLALLNSTLGMFLIEASAAPMALGALDTRSETFANMYMLDPALLSQEQRDKIVESFNPIKQRKVLDVFEEIQTPERIAFDKIVCEVYGLSDICEDVYTALKSLVGARLKR